jgi:hypothetical protein
MSLFLHRIVIILLLVGYSAGAHAALRQLISLPSPTAGLPCVGLQTGKEKEPRRPLWTQRRHLPLVQIFSLVPGEPPRIFLPPGTERAFVDPAGGRILTLAADYFSSRGNKAPPRG